MNRQPQDHRKKLVRYHGFNKTQLKPNEFEWNTPKARAWRQRARDTLDMRRVLVTLSALNLMLTKNPKGFEGSIRSTTVSSLVKPDLRRRIFRRYPHKHIAAFSGVIAPGKAPRSGD